MNMERHIKAHHNQFWHMADGEAAQGRRCSGASTTSISPSWTCRRILPGDGAIRVPGPRAGAGQLTYRGRPVDPEAIRRTALLTVEGEKDDICAIGQTMAALDLCRGVRAHDEAPPPADRRRPLRRLQRQAVGAADLSAGARGDPDERGVRRAIVALAGGVVYRNIVSSRCPIHTRPRPVPATINCSNSSMVKAPSPESHLRPWFAGIRGRTGLNIFEAY